MTWLFGPVASTNVALTLAPALSAWGCFVACRRLTSWPVAPWLAAFLFGYSPFVVDNLAIGHVYLALLVVLPLLVLVTHELLVTQRGRPWHWGLALGLLVVAQFLISSEILAMAGLIGALGLAAWAAFSFRRLPERLPFALRGAAVASVVVALLLAFPLWFTLEGPRHISGSPWPLIQLQGNRLVDLVDPGRYAAPANAIVRIGGYEGLNGPTTAYLGLGVLVLAGVALVVGWRRRLARVSALLAAVALWFSLGAVAWGGGFHYVSGPFLAWHELGSLPVLDRVIPQRFAAFSTLFVALLLALGLDEGYRLARTGRTARAGHAAGQVTAEPGAAGQVTAEPGATGPGTAEPGATARPRRRWAPVGAGVIAVVLALGALVPIWRTYQVPLTVRSPHEPAWFATTARQVPAGSVVLAYPFPSPKAGTSSAMVWQAQDAMRFDLAGGYAKIPGPASTAYDSGPPGSATATLAALSSPAAGALPAGSSRVVATLRGALDRWRVSYVVVTDRGRDPAYAAALFTAVLARAPTVSHGAWVWHLDRPVTAVPARSRADTTAAAAALAACPTPAAGVRAASPVTDRCVAARLATPTP